MCCGAAGRAYLWPPLSSGGASRARPWSVSTSRSSNRTCGFPASGSRTRATLSPTESCAFGPLGGPVPTFHRDIRRGTAHDEIIRKVDDVRPVALHPTPLFPAQNKPPDVQIGQQGRQRGSRWRALSGPFPLPRRFRLIPIPDRRFEKPLDQRQHFPVADPPRHTLHQFGMRYRVEVAAGPRWLSRSRPAGSRPGDSPSAVALPPVRPTTVPGRTLRSGRNSVRPCLKHRTVPYVPQAPPNTMRELTHPTPLRDLDLQATVVARSPLFRSIEPADG